jgi:hypothetical protein
MTIRKVDDPEFHKGIDEEEVLHCTHYSQSETPRACATTSSYIKTMYHPSLTHIL